MKIKTTAVFKKFPVSSTAIVVFVFIVVEALFSFCTTITCPPFADAYFDRWLPYKQNQVVYFLSSRGNKDTLQIEHVNKSPAYTSSGGWGDCGTDALITSTSSHNIFKFNVTYRRSSAAEFITLDFYTFHLVADRINNEGFVLKDTRNYSTQNFLFTTIGNQRFAKAFSVARDTTSNKLPGVYKIWMGQQQGIVAFQNFPSMELWVKQ